MDKDGMTEIATARFLQDLIYIDIMAIFAIGFLTNF